MTYPNLRLGKVFLKAVISKMKSGKWIRDKWEEKSMYNIMKVREHGTKK